MKRRLRTPVWMYHHVEPRPLVPCARHAESYLPPEELAAHLALLRRRGYRTLTFVQLSQLWRGGRAVPRKTIVLTFDDGCRCFLERAFPLLRAHRMSATLFVVSGELGGTNRWDLAEGERREPLLGVEELRHLAEGIEVACHSRSHPLLPNLDRGRLEAETAGSKTDLEAALGHPIQTFCYPYGRSSPEAREAVRDAGFLAAAAIEGHPGARLDDPWSVPRMILRPGESRFELLLKATGAYRLWRQLPRLGLLSALSRREGRPR